MDVDFFNRLYQGYAAEHVISSELSRLGFEVFRIPADFGIDLVVTNQFRRARGITDYSNNFPFGFQVKSRWLKPRDITVGTNGRPRATIDFFLKPEELELLIAQQTTGVAFVSFWPEAKQEFHPRWFWVDSANLAELSRRGFLREKENKLTLTVEYRLYPQIAKKEFISALFKQFPSQAAIISQLEKDLPPTFRRNWNASDYLKFARTARVRQNEPVFRTVWDVQTDFRAFPKHIKIGGLD